MTEKNSFVVKFPINILCQGVFKIWLFELPFLNNIVKSSHVDVGIICEY